MQFATLKIKMYFHKTVLLDMRKNMLTMMLIVMHFAVHNFQLIQRLIHLMLLSTMDQQRTLSIVSVCHV